MILDDIEAASVDERAALQTRRLAALADRLSGHAFFGPRLREAGPVRDLADLAAVPLVSKQDLWDHYPFGLLAVDRAELRRVHATSGSRGRPTIVGYTAADLDIFATVTARALAAADAGPGTVVHNAYGYGLFTGGLGLHGGAERLGCCVVPVSGGQTARQVTLVRDLRPEVLLCTPSYAALLGEALVAAGVAPADNPLRMGIFGAEPWSEGLRARVESLHGITALDIYGLCEVIGPGVAFECPQARAEDAGLHVNDDHFLVEVLDPVTRTPVADGVVGELVFTTLTKEALPLLRYATGDLASVSRTPCGCGRTTPRMSRLVGRRDDMLVVRGVNVHPGEVETLLLETAELAPHYTLVVDSRRPLAELTVVCEPAAGVAVDAEGLGRVFAVRLAERLGLTARVVVGTPGSVPRSETGKAVRVVHRTPEADQVPASLRGLLDG